MYQIKFNEREKVCKRIIEGKRERERKREREKERKREREKERERVSEEVFYVLY